MRVEQLAHGWWGGRARYTSVPMTPAAVRIAHRHGITTSPAHPEVLSSHSRMRSSVQFPSPPSATRRRDAEFASLGDKVSFNDQLDEYYSSTDDQLVQQASRTTTDEPATNFYHRHRTTAERGYTTGAVHL